MHIILKISIILAGLWAAIRPAAYCGLSFFFRDSSAFIDLLVLGICVIVVCNAFYVLPRFLWVLALVMLLVFGSVGFFYHFQDVDESSPLPYEWLNGYYLHAFPLILLSVIGGLKRKRGLTSS